MGTPPPSEPGAPPSEPSSTSPPSQKDSFSDDGVEISEGGALHSLLASLGLGQYLAPLSELGAEEPADIELVSEGELQQIGMKPIQARKLLRAVQPSPDPVAQVQPPPAPPVAQTIEAAATSHTQNDDPKPPRKTKAPKRNTGQSSKLAKGGTGAKASLPPLPAGSKKKKKKKKAKVAAEEPLPEPEETGPLVGDEFSLAGFPGERYNGLYWRDEKGVPLYNNYPQYVSATEMHVYFDTERGQQRWVLAENLPDATAGRLVAALQLDHVASRLPLGTNCWKFVDPLTGGIREHDVQLCRAHTQVGGDTAELFAAWQQPKQPNRSLQAGGGAGSQGGRRIKQAIKRAGFLNGGGNSEPQVLSPLDIDDMAKYFGFDIIENPPLRSLVEEFLRAPLPSGWEEWYDASHGVMYYSCTWPATCSWYHPYEDYYRHLLQRLAYLSTEAAALRADNQRQLAEQMQSRYNSLRAQHEATVDGWMAEESEIQREVRAVRYVSFFREEMDRRETAATTVATPLLVFQGTSKQLSTWRKLGGRTPDILRRNQLMEQTRVLVGDMQSWKGLTQGAFLRRIRDQQQARCSAATNIQKIARSMRPRKMLLEAKARRIQEELMHNTKLNDIAQKVMRRMMALSLARCLSMWAVWTFKMSNARVLMQQLASSRQEQFFQSWVSFIEETAYAKKQMERASKMAMRLMHQTLAKCFQNWSEWVAKVYAAMQMAHQLLSGLKRQYYEDWDHYVQLCKNNARHHRHAQTFVLRMQMRAVAKCVQRWADWSNRMSQVKCLLNQYLVGMQQQCFDEWVYLREERIRKNRKTSAATKMVVRMRKQAAARCVQAWSTWTAKVLSAQQMAHHLQGGFMRVCLYMWMDCAYLSKQKKVKLEIADKFAEETTNGLALECLQQWAERLRKIHASRQMLQKMRGKVVAEVVYGWREWAMDRREWAVEFERRSSYMCNKRVIRTSRRCWVAWRQRAYVRWLSNDYYSFVQRRRRKEELQAWAVWARACRRAETSFRLRRRDQFRAMLQHWRRWAVRKFAARTELNRKLRREVEKAQSAAVIAAHHLERRMGSSGTDVEPHEQGNGAHRSGSSSARPHLDAVQRQMISLGDVSEDVDYVLQLQKRAELCQSHLEKARQGLMHPKAALATLHSLTGSPPKRQAAAPRLPPVSASDRWRPTPRAGKQADTQPSASAKYLVTDSPTMAQQYAVLAKKAVVRVDADPDSPLVEELLRGTVVTAAEEKVVAGHTRVRVGDSRWVSKVTAKGKVLLEELTPQQ